MSNSTDSAADWLTSSISTRWTDDPLPMETQAVMLLWKVCPPCLLLLGSFGNIATVFVMRRIKDDHSSQHLILMALAVSDFSMLYVSLLRQWLYFTWGVDVYDVHGAVCKVSWWMIYATSTTSSWLLTAVTVQRTLAVTLPHRISTLCSLHRTRVVIALTVSAAFLLHVHFVYGMEIPADRCTFRSAGYRDFVTRVWSWVDLAVFTLLPSACLLLCDVILSVTLFKAASAASVTARCAVTSTGTDQVNRSRRKRALSTTVLILALSCTFLLLTLPVCVYHVWEYHAQPRVPPDTPLLAAPSLFFAITMLLWYTNGAVNFLLYCFTGARFRGEFFSWVCCTARGHPHSRSVGTSHSGFVGGVRDKHQ
ncbi:growth hormone secretagogue receptor type 1-like [Babylonia areolata]|uniref:growth hormone secretagogue receptor type 1-like n=1 Tax=Babylonia areolata TaxID=304850 RepID=UPI003FD00597